MALTLMKKAILSNPHVIRNLTGAYYFASRNAGHWNYQYKPGPYPKTAAERAAAAKKYGMTPEEYQPYPEDMCYGDYPKLPDIGADSKDPYYPYDLPYLRRNFNEPINARGEIYGEDRCDPAMRPRFPVWYQFAFLMSVLGGSFALYYYLEDFKMGRPVTAKQYPGVNGPHFEFWPNEPHH